MTYNAIAARNRLVKEGHLSPEAAETVMAVILEHDDATGQGLATKADLHELRAGLLHAIYFALLAQTLAVVALTTGLTVTLVKVLH
jgi:hypothetical protein